MRHRIKQMFPSQLAFTLLLASIGVAGASLQASAQTPAQENNEFVGRVLGAMPGDQAANACFVRTYDAAHLAQHPKQKVTSMMMLVHAAEINDDGGANYSFVIGLKQRGRKGLYDTAGSCSHVRADGEGPITHLRCGVDCDGGGVSVEMANDDKSIMVRINDYVSINKPGTNKSDDEDHAMREGLRPGLDDKAFRLDRVAVEQCGKMFDTPKEFREFLAAK